MFTYFDGLSGAPIVRLSQACVNACSHSGPCDDDVAHWVPRVEWLADDATLRRSLRECGAWDDLDSADTDTLRSRALWLAACDCKESPDMYA